MSMQIPPSLGGALQNPYQDDADARAEAIRLYMLKTYTPLWIADYVGRDVDTISRWIQEHQVSLAPTSHAPPATSSDAQQRLMRLRDTLDPMIAAGNVAAIRTALQLEVEIARLAGLYDQKPPPDEHINYQIEGVSEDDLR